MRSQILMTNQINLKIDAEERRWTLTPKSHLRISELFL